MSTTQSPETETGTDPDFVCADTILARMPAGIDHSADMLAEYASTIPDGTPPQVLSLLRRTFVAGALSHMEQVRRACMLPELADGDPTPLLNVIAALGIGASVLLEQESQLIAAGLDRPDSSTKIIVPGPRGVVQ